MHFKNHLNQITQSDLQTLNALKFIQQNQQNTQPSFYAPQQSQHLSNHTSNGGMAQSQQRPILGLNQLLQSDCNSNHLKNWQNNSMNNNNNSNGNGGSNNNNNNGNDMHLDRAARFHRSSAALCMFYDSHKLHKINKLNEMNNIATHIDDATCTWSGFLQPRVHKVVNYSPKVFLGGIPWDISEQSLIQIFKQFGPIKYDSRIVKLFAFLSKPLIHFVLFPFVL